MQTFTKNNSISKILRYRSKKNADDRAIGFFQGQTLKYLTFADYYKEIKKLSLGLLKLDLQKNNKVAILSKTSHYWNLIDHSITASNLVTVPIYPTFTSDEIAYICNHSESQVLFIENNDQLKKITQLQDSFETVRVIVGINDLDKKLVESLHEKFRYIDLENLKIEPSLDENNVIEDNINEQNPSDPASIIYTSGTTGTPKGAVISHKAFVQMFRNVRNMFEELIDNSDVFFTTLPLSHVLGRCDSFMNLVFASCNVYGSAIENFASEINKVKPTIVVTVPRILEKVYEATVGQIQVQSILKQKAFDFGMEASKKYFFKIDRDISPSTSEIIKRELSYNTIFKQVFEKLGGSIRFLISGGAPLSTDIIQFLRYCNLTVLEGYGLTETAAPCFVNSAVKQITGTVGLPMGDVKVRFGEDDEIELKTEALFTGYFKDEEGTKEVFSEDGWFKTGDIGRLNEYGYLTITDRKKNIIITSGGKNVAPQKIENVMKLQPHISQIMVLGDRKKYLSAVISIEKENLLGDLDNLGIKRNIPHEELAEHPAILKLIRREIDEANKKLARFEQIKKFIIAPWPINPENGTMSPSMKIKRNIVQERLKDGIDAMYHD